MRILIAGAGGFIGSHTVPLLQQTGHTLVGLSRRPRDAGIEWRAGDVTDPASLERATEGIDCVVHAVQFPGHPVENPKKGWTYLDVDAAGTTNMVEACKRNGVRRFIYLSGIGVREGRHERWFRAKWIAEEAIRRSGMEWVILRPSWVYGPDDHSMNRFVTMIRKLPFVPVIGSGTPRVRPVYIEDVAQVVAASVDLQAATGNAYDLGSPQALTMNEVLLTLQKVMGVHRPLVHFPVGFMKAQASLLALLPDPPLSPGAIDFLMMEEPVDPAPTEAAFGIRFRSLEEGLAYLRPGK